MARKVRFGILVFAASVIALFLLYQAMVALSAGAYTLELGRSGYSRTFERGQDPFWFHFWVLFNVIVALGFLVWGAFGARALLGRTSQNASSIDDAIDALENRAPSGLIPLWIAILIAIAAFAIYVA